MNNEFDNTSEILSTLTVSIFILGFAIGPLIFSPLSEIYGRVPILNCCNAFLVVWQLGCALAPNIGAIIAMRFLGGIGGSACRELLPLRFLARNHDIENLKASCLGSRAQVFTHKMSISIRGDKSRHAYEPLETALKTCLTLSTLSLTCL